jgi:hypothetical protein
MEFNNSQELLTNRMPRLQKLNAFENSLVEPRLLVLVACTESTLSSV